MYAYWKPVHTLVGIGTAQISCVALHWGTGSPSRVQTPSTFPQELMHISSSVQRAVGIQLKQADSLAAPVLSATYSRLLVQPVLSRLALTVLPRPHGFGLGHGTLTPHGNVGPSLQFGTHVRPVILHPSV